MARWRIGLSQSGDIAVRRFGDQVWRHTEVAGEFYNNTAVSFSARADISRNFVLRIAKREILEEAQAINESVDPEFRKNWEHIAVGRLKRGD